MVEFKKQVLGTLENDTAASPMNTFSIAGDINGDGVTDFVVCGRNGTMAWFENKGEDMPWVKHVIGEVVSQECGGSLYDLTGNGLPDIINGGDWQNTKVSWWENTGEFDKPWVEREIINTGFGQIHDTLVGDIKGNGEQGLIFSNQMTGNGTNIYYIPIPEDPRVTPWPGHELVGNGKSEPNPFHAGGFQPEEGLAIGDLDGDGVNELVCGTHWYKYNGTGWDCHKFAAGYITTKIAVSDVDGDGRNEILLSEGDPYIYGKEEGGTLSWFKPGEDIAAMWEEHVIADSLLDPHSLKAGDILGAGHMDIMLGEVGVDDGKRGFRIREPQIYIFENDGKGNFTKHIIDSGTGIHEACLIDLNGDGCLDIIGKPLQGKERWNLHVYYNLRAEKLL